MPMMLTWTTATWRLSDLIETNFFCHCCFETLTLMLNTFHIHCYKIILDSKYISHNDAILFYLRFSTFEVYFFRFINFIALFRDFQQVYTWAPTSFYFFFPFKLFLLLFIYYFFFFLSKVLSWLILPSYVLMMEWGIESGCNSILTHKSYWKQPTWGFRTWVDTI